MEKESTSTWAFLDKSGEIVNVESDPGSSSESSIEFIHDDSVHYERKDHRKSSFQPEIQDNSQDVVENLSGVLDVDGAVFEAATAADNVSAIKEGSGEKSRGEFTLENISSVNSNASVSPDSTSPVSPSSSDDSSGSVTLLEGCFSDGDSDFELLDQQSSSDSAHLQLAAGVSNTSPAAQRPKFNIKFKKQAVGTSETKSIDDSDADDESSNNIELPSSPEESEVAPGAPVEEIPPVTNLGSLSPVPPPLSLSTLVLKRPRMSVTFLMLASLVFGLLLGFTTKYSFGPYSSDQLSEDIEEIQRINEVHLLREENEHMRKYVDSLKWRMNNLQNSNKQQLLDELQQVNQLLKGRLDELSQQLDQLVVRRDILKATPEGPQPPTLSDTTKQDFPADIHQEVNEPASEDHPESQTEMTNAVGVASHDDIIQIHSSPEELAPEENLDESSSQGITDEVSGFDVPLADIQQNDASIGSDEIIKSENKADDAIAVLQIKMEEEKRRADNFEKLYVQLKNLVDSREPDADSSALETVEKAKKFEESESYCSPLDKDCDASMSLLNQEAMIQLIKSVISEIPPHAQQWKEYVSQKFHTILDSQDQEESDEKLNVEPQTASNFQFKKMNAYMNRMLSQMNKAKEDLQNKFEKTLFRIKKEASKFWKKTVSKKEKGMKFKKSKQRKQDAELEEIIDDETKHRSSQDSILQLTDKNDYFDTIDMKEELKISQKTEESGELKKEVEVVEMKQNKKTKSFRSKSGKVRQHDRSDDSKKHRPHKSSRKEKKQQATKAKNEDRKHRHKLNDEKQKSDFEGKKSQSHKLKSKEKKQDRMDDDKKHRPHKSDKGKKHRHKYNDDDKAKLDDDIKHGSLKSNNKEKKRRYKYNNDDEKDMLDDDIKHGSQKSNDGKKHRLQKSDSQKKKYRTKESDDDGTKKQGYKSAKDEKHRQRKSNDERKQFRKHKSKDNDKRIIDKSLFNAKSASHGRIKRQAKVYSDDEESLKYQKNLRKKLNKKYKNDPEVKAQSKDSCDQLAVRLEDSINTISKEKFRRMKLHSIVRMSKKLSIFNKQCKHFSPRSMKEWSACQQMWWTLCGQGFLPGPLQSSKCQHYLHAWQMLAAASPDGGGKPSCDDCGCQKRAEKQKHSLDKNEDQQNATNSDSATRNEKEEKKVKSGEWYFKLKSVPEENKEQDCDDNEFECMSEDLWDEHENVRLQDFDQMMKSEFHRFNHHNHVHRRRCKDHNKHNIYCYSLFHPMHKGIKWASAYYQNMMNLIQNWQRQHI